MEKIEKIPVTDSKRENEYAREELRLARVLKGKISEDGAADIVLKLEKLFKENDEIVASILSHPQIIENYDVDAYDGLELKAKPPAEFPIHFIRDGLWLMRHLDESNLSAFDRGQNFDAQGLLDWLQKDVSFNRLRLQQLQETGSVMITDPAKVRIKKINLGQNSPPDKTDGKKTIH